MGSEPGRRRGGRPAAGQTPLTEERILSAALRLVEEHGLADLSMRRLAAALGVDPMAIYHHLPSKGALVAGLVRRVFAELPAPADGGSAWQARVRAFARAYRDLQSLGLLLPIRGTGLAITPSAPRQCRKERLDLIRDRLLAVLREAVMNGVSHEEINRLVKSVLSDLPERTIET